LSIALQAATEHRRTGRAIHGGRPKSAANPRASPSSAGTLYIAGKITQVSMWVVRGTWKKACANHRHAGGVWDARAAIA
jgi:hypothetical protein